MRRARLLGGRSWLLLRRVGSRIVVGANLGIYEGKKSPRQRLVLVESIADFQYYERHNDRRCEKQGLTPVGCQRAHMSQEKTGGQIHPS